jgi:hypothetical protein
LILAGKFVREAAAALLRMAKTTSDQNLAAALVEKAADLKDRVGEARSIDVGLQAPDVTDDKSGSP